MLSKFLLNVKVLSSSEIPEPANNAKKIVKKKPDTKVSSEENSETSDKVSDEENQEDEVKPRKKSVPKGKMQTSAGPKKRKGEEANLPSKKRAKPAKAASDNKSDAEDDEKNSKDNGKNSEDDQSQSSTEKPTKVKLNY